MYNILFRIPCEQCKRESHHLRGNGNTLRTVQVRFPFSLLFINYFFSDKVIIIYLHPFLKKTKRLLKNGCFEIIYFLRFFRPKKNRRRIAQKCLALSDFSVYLLVISPLTFFAYHDAAEYTPWSTKTLMSSVSYFLHPKKLGYRCHKA